MRVMTSLSITRRRNGRARGVGAMLIAMVCVAALEARAQGSAVSGVPNAVQGFSQNRDKPIQIDAGSLEVRDKDKAATFKGDVKVVQGDTTMHCKVLVVYYEGSANPSAPPAPAPPKPTMTSATPGPTGSSSIRRLEAKGGVIVTQKDQTVTGETGVFDMKSNTVTMLDNVILTKGENVVRGDKLIVDMTTGVSRVESKNGRVNALIKSSGQGAGGPPSLIPGGNSGETTAPAAKPPAGKPMNLNDLTGSGKR
jgi:lipopolysaccharide export system protein LptA